MAFFRPGAGGVWNSLGAGFASHAAGDVWNLLGDALLFEPNTGVRNGFGFANWNPSADGVRLLAVTNFAFHAGAGHGLGDALRNPSAAANGRWWELFANLAAATGLVAHAAAAAVPFPGTWIANALFDHLTRNLLGSGDPLAAGFLNLLVFGHWLANGVADVAVVSFAFGAVGDAVDLAILGFVDGLADGAGHVAVAGIEDWLADRVADIAVAGLINGLLHLTANFAVAGLEDWFANLAGYFFIAGLKDWLADGVAFIAVASFVDVAGAGHGSCFGALIVDRAANVVLLVIVDCFANSLVARGGAALGGNVVAAGCTRCGWAALVAGSAAVACVGLAAKCEGQQPCSSNEECLVSHLSIPVFFQSVV
jgi:hypothetical protein